MTKVYGQFGVQIDPDFQSHRDNCEQCCALILPAELAKLCLEGSVLWKRENVRVRKTKVPQTTDIFGETGINRTTKTHAKLLMRYKP